MMYNDNGEKGCRLFRAAGTKQAAFLYGSVCTADIVI